MLNHASISFVFIVFLKVFEICVVAKSGGTIRTLFGTYFTSRVSEQIISFLNKTNIK